MVNTSLCCRKVSRLFLCGTWHEFQCFCVGLSHTHRQTHAHKHTYTLWFFISQRLPPPCGEKNLQLLQIFPFSPLQKRDPCLSQAPRCSKWASKRIICSAHPKDSTRRPHSKSVKIVTHYWPFSLRLMRAPRPCAFNECSIVSPSHSMLLPGVLKSNFY